MVYQIDLDLILMGSQNEVVHTTTLNFARFCVDPLDHPELHALEDDIPSHTCFDSPNSLIRSLSLLSPFSLNLFRGCR